MRSSLAPGVWFLRAFSRDSWFRGFILLLTFLIYACYHMSRKPISIVKSRLHQNCSEMVRPVNDTHDLNDTTWCSWSPFDKDDYKELLGAVDNAFLVAYAIGMFISGIFGERLPLRYYLSAGMVLSGLFTSLFGLGYFWNIHMLWYFVLIQICNGLVQTTGWPSVVTCVGNWFGKGNMHSFSPQDASSETQQVMSIENCQMFEDVPQGAESPPSQLKTTVRVILMGFKEKNGRLMISLWSEFPSVLVLGAS